MRPTIAAPATGRSARRLDALRQAGAMLAELLRSRAPFRAGLMILPYAGLLVGLDVAAQYGALTDAALPVQFFLSSDGGFGEWLEYALTASVAAMLLILCLERFDWAYLTNGLLFVWLTLDNSLEVHEASGEVLAPLFADSGLAIEPHHLGEAAMFLAVGCVWLAGLALSLRRARWRPALHALLLAGCIAAVAFFGVFVDLMVVWGPHGATWLEIETLIEDGGEFTMIIVSFLLAVAIFDTERRRAANRP